jgi:hypothetical protein
MSRPGGFSTTPLGTEPPGTDQGPTEKKKIFSLPGIEFQSSGRPTPGLATILSYPGSHK